ncbi:class I SAM-dependent methyltransferase [Moritella sp. 24]|uniref:class I SAM-dependent DNA methyltransferase n=1 Tax=Moritella sp. 24 TaxID=2746230 RepID=UPI001BABB884|nr:class I SAM-dependent methyltransferase [Moritella sp. 24]QUM75091.1 class I SAM-dependent methyltransferase [Moritella sp. 24]
MHTKSVQYHDFIYEFVDFEKEANFIDAIIQEQLPSANTILDVACGPHEHVKTLRSKYQVDGIDINKEFLPIAKLKNPSGNYEQANMCNFKLGKLYDVVICLASSISYVKNVSELNDTLKCFANHLNPEGMVIVVPWFTLDTWTPGKVSMVFCEEKQLKIARASVRSNNGKQSRMHFTYMVATPDGVDTFTEDHYLMLFSKDELVNAFESAGLKVTQSNGWTPGRGLILGLKNI